MSSFTAFRQAAVAAAALMLLAGCSSKQDRIESGLKKGAEYVRLTDWDKASVEVRNVLQIDPKNAQGYVLAAQIGEGQHNLQRAYFSYLKATELKPELLPAKLGLARMYLVGGEAAKAGKAIDEVLALDSANPGARTLRAALLASEGKTAEAQALAQAVIGADKVVPADAAMLLAGLYANQGQRAQALDVIERALQSDPKDTSLLRVAATIAGDAPAADPIGAKAAGYFRRAVQETPKNGELWHAWASLHLRRAEPEMAENVLREAARALPEDGTRELELLQFLEARHGFAAAETEAKTAIAARPRDMSLRFGLANLYRNANRHADAQRLLAQIVDLGDDTPSVLQAKTQLAVYHLAAGQGSEARQLIAQVLKANPRDNGALLLRGRLNLMDGQPADAVIDLRAVVKDQPGSPQAVGLLAQAHHLAGEHALAREVLADAVKFHPEDPELHLLLAGDLADGKDIPAAIAEIDAGLRDAPLAARLYETKAQLAMARKDAALAEKTLQTLKAKLPQSAVGYVRLGQFYAEQRRFDAALAEYDAGAAAVPGEPMPYVAAIGQLVGMKKFDEARARIEHHLQQEPKNVLHMQLLGDVAVARGDLAGAERAYRNAIAAAPQAAVGYINTARVLAQRGDVPAALAVLQQGEQAAPAETAIALARAEWLTKAKRYDEAITVYDALAKRVPDDANVANNLAYLLAEVKGDRPSVERALVLASRFAESRNPGQLDSLGWIHHKLGEYDKAVPLLERAVALAPSSAIINLHLGQSLVKSGSAERGKALIRKAIDGQQDLPHLDEAKAMLAQG